MARHSPVELAMPTRVPRPWRPWFALAFALPPCICACHSLGGVAAGAAVITVVGAQAPSQSIEQTYYVGIFDPLEQLPPAVYRLTVRGQASSISAMRFASGWVPAALIDGLGSRIGFNDQGQVTVDSEEASASSLASSRRLMMFGPEGFREAPKDHRLAIVMGSSPEAFFAAIENSLAAVVSVQQERLESGEAQRILEELYRLQGERQQIDEVADRLEATRRSEEGK